MNAHGNCTTASRSARTVIGSPGILLSGFIAVAIIAVIALAGSKTKPHGLMDSMAAPVHASKLQVASYVPLAYAIWIYDPTTGQPTYEASCSYATGHIFDDAVIIGSVPDPTNDGSIYDGNNVVIGFIAPSPAATAQLSPGG